MDVAESVAWSMEVSLSDTAPSSFNVLWASMTEYICRSVRSTSQPYSYQQSVTRFSCRVSSDPLICSDNIFLQECHRKNISNICGSRTRLQPMMIDHELLGVRIAATVHGSTWPDICSLYQNYLHSSQVEVSCRLRNLAWDFFAAEGLK